MDGREIVARAQALARHSDSTQHYTRTYLTPAHQAAAREIGQWMREAGMSVRVDAIGNVFGRYEADAAGAKALLIGSHYDSVRNGGKYDGVLGILLGIACVDSLHREGLRMPFALEVGAFADEEGARFQTGMLSSRTLVSGFDASLLDRRDAQGVTLGEAMRAAGLDPRRAGDARIDASRLAGYVEVHIEQGPVLLDAGVALGVVTSIAAGARHAMTVTGEKGHAGTVPMPMRHDALAAAAEMIVAIERRCRAGGSLVGTVGILEVKDGTGNVIPGEVRFTVDIRAADAATLADAQRDVFAELDAIAARRGVKLAGNRTHDVRPVPCSPRMQEQIAASVERALGTRPARRLPSGAGHDAMIFAEVTEVGMMFVRCGAGGVSHSPEETVTAADAGLALAALADFVRNFEATATKPA
jgi:hydantoinase/carbamoylase family amidase